jgi:hypothetical protein
VLSTPLPLRLGKDSGRVDLVLESLHESGASWCRVLFGVHAGVKNMSRETGAKRTLFR